MAHQCLHASGRSPALPPSLQRRPRHRRIPPGGQRRLGTRRLCPGRRRRPVSGRPSRFPDRRRRSSAGAQGTASPTRSAELLGHHGWRGMYLEGRWCLRCRVVSLPAFLREGKRQSPRGGPVRLGWHAGARSPRPGGDRNAPGSHSRTSRSLGRGRGVIPRGGRITERHLPSRSDADSRHRRDRSPGHARGAAGRSNARERDHQRPGDGWAHLRDGVRHAARALPLPPRHALWHLVGHQGGLCHDRAHAPCLSPRSRGRRHPHRRRPRCHGGP